MATCATSTTHGNYMKPKFFSNPRTTTDKEELLQCTKSRTHSQNSHYRLQDAKGFETVTEILHVAQTDRPTVLQYSSRTLSQVPLACLSLRKNFKATVQSRTHKSDGKFLCNAPRCVNGHCVLERSHASPACPEKQHLAVDEGAAVVP